MRLSFDGFDIDLDSGQLFVAGKAVPLEPRAIDLLCYLASHPGRLITKDELLAEVWRVQSLSESVMSNTAVKVRKALGQDAGTREPIETIRGRGFRWHAVRRGGSRTTDASTPARTDAFVGRVQVLEVLERALDQASQGAGQTVILAGAAGMGKTRTLDELAKRARAHGFSVWEGAAYDGGGVPPYWLWVEVLRSAHVDLSGAMFRRHLAPDTWAMSLLVPELMDVAPTKAAADLQATRFRLFNEMVRFIAAASVDAPRLILADDVHWADIETLELLAHAARALKKHAVVLAITLREQDTTGADARADVLRRLSRQATHVALSGLSELEVGELAAALGDSRPLAAGVPGLLYERTQGNPFFVRQTLELMAQHGGLALDARGLASLSLPEAVRSILQQRIVALDESTLRVLRMAAAAGTELDASLLADALELPLAEVLSALEPARRRGVVVAHPTAAHRFGFDHALLRDLIYDALGLAERGEYHARLGHALERRQAAGDPRRLGEIAHHFLLAVPSELEACVRHCRNAAAAARDTLGFGAAAELLSRVCEKLAREGGHERTRCELLRFLGNDRFCTGDVPGAWQALRQGAVLSEQIGATDLFASFAFLLASWLELGGGDEDEARRLIDRALRAVGDGDPDLRATLLASRAVMHFELPAEERGALLAEADALAARHNAPEVQLDLAVSRVSVRDPTRIDESRDATARLRALMQQYHDPRPYRSLHEFSADLTDFLTALTAGDLDAADAAIDRCRWLAERSRVAAVELTVELMQAGRALGDGRLDDLAATLQRVSEGSGVTAGGFSLVWNNYALRLIEARGDLAALAGVDLEQNVSRFDELRTTQRMNAMLYLASFAMKVGAHDDSRRFLANIPRQELARMPVRYGDLGLLCLTAEVYEAFGDSESAEALYARLLPHEERNAVLPAFDYCGAVAHYLGILAQLLGHHERAVRHFERAEVINRQLRMPVEQSRTSARAEAARAIASRVDGRRSR